MPVFEIANVQSQVRPWNSTKGGPMKSYRIDLKDEAGELRPSVEWARKESSPPPEVGQRIEGDVTSGDYGLKFKQAQNGNGGGGMRQRDPVEGARIMRQHSQEMGLRYVAIRGKPDFSLDELRKVIDWFDSDAKAATP